MIKPFIYQVESLCFEFPLDCGSLSRGWGLQWDHISASPTYFSVISFLSVLCEGVSLPVFSPFPEEVVSYTVKDAVCPWQKVGSGSSYISILKKTSMCSVWSYVSEKCLSETCDQIYHTAVLVQSWKERSKIDVHLRYLVFKLWVCLRLPKEVDWSFPGGASAKEPACQCRTHKRWGFDPWVRKIPWTRAWNPSHYCCLETPHGQRSLVGYNTRFRHNWSDLADTHGQGSWLESL